MTSPALSRSNSRTSPSSCRKRSSPSRRKISGIERPSPATIMSSVSTTQRLRRWASRRPHIVLPAPMNPTSTMLLARIVPTLTLLRWRGPAGPPTRGQSHAERERRALGPGQIQATDDFPEAGQERDRDEAAHEPAHVKPREESQKHGEGVEAGRATDEVRRQKLALEKTRRPEEPGGGQSQHERLVERRHDPEPGGDDRADEGHDVEHGRQRSDQQGVFHPEQRPTDRK